MSDLKALRGWLVTWAADWQAASEVERDTAAHVRRGFAGPAEAWAWVAEMQVAPTGPGRATGEASLRIAGCVAWLIEAGAGRRGSRRGRR